jgi:triacylglycerol lipase
LQPHLDELDPGSWRSLIKSTLSRTMKPSLKHPVVLCHGLFGTHKYGAGPFSAGDYFRGILREMRSWGLEVHAPRVHPTAGVYRRAWKLAERIEASLGDRPFHLVGHSMGGLDARLLASDPAWASRVVSLTTIGTPHLGTCLADMAATNLRLLYSGLEKIGLDVDGIRQVMTHHAAALGHDWADPPRAACFSIAGNPDPTEVFFGVRPVMRWIYQRQGPNDGLVPMESALGWGEPLPPWPHDHFRQINWMTPRRHAPAVVGSYHELVLRLMEIEPDFVPRFNVRAGWGDPVAV